MKCKECGNELSPPIAVAVYIPPDNDADALNIEEGKPIELKLDSYFLPLAMFECQKCGSVYFKKTPGVSPLTFIAVVDKEEGGA